MIKLENFIDKQIFLILRDIKTLAATGLEKDCLIATIKGYEERHGIWIEVDSLKACPVKSGDNSLEDCPAIIFIPWYHIVSMVHFTGKEKIELVQQKLRKIGFRQE